MARHRSLGSTRGVAAWLVVAALSCAALGLVATGAGCRDGTTKSPPTKATMPVGPLDATPEVLFGFPPRPAGTRAGAVVLANFIDQHKTDDLRDLSELLPSSAAARYLELTTDLLNSAPLAAESCDGNYLASSGVQVPIQLLPDLAKRMLEAARAANDPEASRQAAHAMAWLGHDLVVATKRQCVMAYFVRESIYDMLSDEQLGALSPANREEREKLTQLKRQITAETTQVRQVLRPPN